MAWELVHAINVLNILEPVYIISGVWWSMSSIFIQRDVCTVIYSKGGRWSQDQCIQNMSSCMERPGHSKVKKGRTRTRQHDVNALTHRVCKHEKFDVPMSFLPGTLVTKVKEKHVLDCTGTTTTKIHILHTSKINIGTRASTMYSCKTRSRAKMSPHELRYSRCAVKVWRRKSQHSSPENAAVKSHSGNEISHDLRLATNLEKQNTL